MLKAKITTTCFCIRKSRYLQNIIIDSENVFSVHKNKEDNYVGEFIRGLKVESGISIEKFFNTKVI